jgi:hypothetical protein
MATTTNYGWTTPDDTALVKDGAAAIRTLGSSVDTTTKNLNPETTLGDISYRSSTANVKTRLPLGTAGQVLKVNSGATAPEWATDASGMTNPMTTTGDTIYSSSGSTPARLGIGSTGQVLTVTGGIPSWATPASGLTLITSATFSNVASVTVDSVFSSTYKSYQVYFDLVSASTAADDLQMQMRYGSTTQNGGVYLGSQFQYNRNNSLQTNGYVSTTTALILQSISTGGTPSLGTINFSQVGQSSQNASFYGNGLDADVQAAAVFAGLTNSGQTYTGFLLKGSSANITGRYAVYGLAN